MGLIAQIFSLLFGGSRHFDRVAAEVFRETAEAAGIRAASGPPAAPDRFRRDFSGPKTGRFDRFMDGVNRVPRPALALGTLTLFGAAMVDPVWFASRMQALALVPEPLWWLMGAIVGFYFGARVQAKDQDFRRAIAETLQRGTEVAAGLRAPGTAEGAPAEADPAPGRDDPSREDRRRGRG
jgi:hypothetical protein